MGDKRGGERHVRLPGLEKERCESGSKLLWEKFAGELKSCSILQLLISTSEMKSVFCVVVSHTMINMLFFPPYKK